MRRFFSPPIMHPTLIACLVLAIGAYATPWIVSVRSVVCFDQTGAPLKSAKAPWLFLATTGMTAIPAGLTATPARQPVNDGSKKG